MSSGKVYLVGAGPGDPGLVTVKGLNCIRTADVVIYDRLVDKRLLAQASKHADMIDVGKIPGDKRNPQAAINAVLVDKAKTGSVVVRLKGGDPFVFGRGGEEALALREEGILFEVVPGITSAIAAPAYAGIPVTHRGVESYFTVVTGSESPDKPESSIDWRNLAKLGGTLVVLMGWESLKSIVNVLVDEGRSPDTPVALVRWGTEPYQHAVVGTLSDIVEKAINAGLSSPVVTIIGDVVNLRQEIRWFDNRPLFGKRVLVTRTRAQASGLSNLLASHGAEPIEVPTIEVRDLDDYTELESQLRSLGEYDWVIFTSTNAVDVVFERLKLLGLDSRSFGGVAVGAIGPATADQLRSHGITADFVPESFVSESIVEGMNDFDMGGKRILLPRAEIARDALSRGLRELGADVQEVVAYRTVTPVESGAIAREALKRGIDVVTFTSSSTVTNLRTLLGSTFEKLSDCMICCIGPITAATARELGLKVDIVSSVHTIPGLVNSLETYFAEESQ